MPVNSLWAPGWLGEPRTHRRGSSAGASVCSVFPECVWLPDGTPRPTSPGGWASLSPDRTRVCHAHLSGATAPPFPRLPCAAVSLPGSAGLVIAHFLPAPPAVGHLSIICLCVCCLSTCMSVIYKSITYLLSVYLYIVCLYIYHLSIIYQSIYVSLIHVSISPHLSDSPQM